MHPPAEKQTRIARARHRTGLSLGLSTPLPGGVPRASAENAAGPGPQVGKCTIRGGGCMDVCTMPGFGDTRPPKTCNLQPLPGNPKQTQAIAQTRTKAGKLHVLGGWVAGILHSAKVYLHPPPENLQFTALARQPQANPSIRPKPEPKPGNCTFWGGGWLEFCTVPRFTCTRPPKTCNLRPILRQPQASAQTRTKAKKLHNLAWPRRSAIYGLSRLLFSAGEGELVSRSGVWF